jgi:hypothetical protein
MPQYCASLQIGVSLEKAPAFAQLFGREILRFPGIYWCPFTLRAIHVVARTAKSVEQPVAEL